MKTDDLIAALAADTVPRPGVAARARWAVPLAALVVLAVVAAGLGIRPDLAQALTDPLPAARWVLALGLAGVAGTAALRLSRPGADERVRSPVVVSGAAVALWAVTFWSTPPEMRAAAIVGQTLAICLVAIPALSIVTTGAILWSLREGATTRPGRAGCLAGLAGGGLAAALYALHCTEDNPLFYVTWYGTGILIAGLGGALAGRRLLRW